MSTGALLLAAGGSTRMQQPKMLLPYKGRTLLEHIAGELLASGAIPVVAVTGTQTINIQELLKGTAVQIVQNEQWGEGMASSIRKGITIITAAALIPDAIIIVVCDQPFVSASLLQQLMQRQLETGKGLVACAYGDTVGTPVLFGKKYFPLLLTLQGQEGAKKLLKQFSDDMAIVPFPQGNIDVDTPADYERLLNSGHTDRNTAEQEEI